MKSSNRKGGQPACLAKLEAAEARAAKAERRLQAVLDAFPEGVVLLDSGGRYISWNKRYAEIYHRSADMFAPGAPLMEVLRRGVARGDYPEAVGAEEAWLATRERQLLDASSRHEQQLSDGSWLLVEDRRTPDGEILGLRIDITELKAQAVALEAAARQAEAASRAKSEFLANVSHEIRTPLHGVLGLTQLLLREDLSGQHRARLELIRGSGQALLNLLNDLLDLAKIEAGKLSLEETAFCLASLLDASCAPLAALAAEKGLGFDVWISPELGGAWRGDPLRLQQILSNLISNAIKFTAAGQVSVRVYPHEGRVAFQVRDSGIGIPADRLEGIFDKFAQVESSTTRRFGGTGLGLAVCRELAGLLGGVLTVESRLGVGSTFTLIAPLAADTRDAPTAHGDATGPAQLSGARLLAAEDNPVNQQILRAVLDPLCELTLVSDGREAVEAYQDGCYDLVLMDIQMPHMDGLDATAAIRAFERSCGRRQVPILALSANAMAHQVDRYREAGMADVVPKPFTLEELISKIAEQLDLGSAAQSAAAEPLRSA